jgi:hypothetical protein
MSDPPCVQSLWWLRDDAFFNQSGPTVFQKVLSEWRLGPPEPSDGAQKGRKKVAEWEYLLTELGLDVVIGAATVR